MVTDQIKKLCNQFDADRLADISDEETAQLRKEIYIKEFNDSSKPRVIQVADAFASFLTQKKIYIRVFDLFAGNLQHMDLRPSVPVTPVKYPSATQAGDARISIDACKEYLSEGALKVMYEFTDAMDSGLFTHTHNGHVTPGFNYYVEIGYQGYKEQIEEELKKDRPLEEVNQLKAMHTVIRAAITYVTRYAKVSKEAAEKTDNPIYKANLERIANSCETLANGKPVTFFDAIQSIIILQELFTLESAAISISIGRLDQILYPFYKTDSITYEDAEELIYAFKIKISALVESYQNIMICGVDKEGNFAGNDVSKMLLHAARDLSYDQPQLCMRYSKNMPKEFLEEALQVIETGCGFPAIFNDDIVIKAKIKAGVLEDDAWDYAASGCVENSFGGREWCNTELIRINWLKVLELILNDGYDFVKDRKYSMVNTKPIDEIESFEELKEIFKKEFANFVKQGTDATSLIESVYYRSYPVPMLSTTIKDCIITGRDAANRGARYNMSTINNAGMANVVDSLLAIKDIVFDQKLMKLSELNEVLNKNFEGEEKLQAYCLNKLPKFGNDLDEPDSLMQELVDYATTLQNGIQNLRGSHYMPGAYGVTFHAHMGACTAASADGRSKGYSLANSMCPVQGMDKESPTAVINGVTRVDHTMFSNGMVLDLKFNRAFFTTEQHREMFFSLIKTYFDKGGLEIQFNVVDRDTLIDAQNNPERYQNLLVRVSGFSAYFVTLHKGCQDEIIARSQYE